jgi:thioester reductase-like protein
MSSLFFTGFPGFLGVELLPKVLGAQEEKTVAHCLVQTRYINYAKKKLSVIESEYPDLSGRIQLHEGDIREPDLGLKDGNKLISDAKSVFHVAAVHDVSARRDAARRVNVDGTRHILAIARQAKKLERFHHVSSCFVSGRYDGMFRESDLEIGQKFNNHLEESKFEGEVSVAQARSEGLPVTVYRPAFIAGDSDTGATQKYDGIYYLIRWILSMPRVFFFPEFGGGPARRMNVVPRDFVVDAITHLSSVKESVGKTYHLADPHPMPFAIMIRSIGKLTGRKLLPLPMPKDAAKLSLRHIPKLQRWTQLPPQATDYFTHPTRYDVENMMTGLKGSGIHAPRLSTYLPNLIEFVRMHGEITSRPMV